MKNLLSKKTKKKGFTLIELIIVLAVMAIIAAIAIPSFTAVRNNSRKKADIQSCETIKRTVLTLVADGTVPTPAKDKKEYLVTFDDSKKMQDINDDTKDGDIKKALSEVKPPQLEKGEKYTITVNANGSVEVKTNSEGVDVK